MLIKYTIPALLLGVVMIAGAFAFMPVQEASTVHTSGVSTSIRDSGIVTDITVESGDSVVIYDNAGIAGTFSAEVTWDFQDSDCQVRSLSGGSWTALIDDDAFDASLTPNVQHADASTIEALALFGNAGVCKLHNNGVNTDYVSYTIVATQ